MPKISITPTDSLSNTDYTPTWGVNKTTLLQGVTLTPTIYIPTSFEDTPALNVTETPVISKSANLSCIPNSTKLQNLDKHQAKQAITETGNLRAEMIALKLFVVDQIYMVKNRSNERDDKLLIKN